MEGSRLSLLLCILAGAIKKGAAAYPLHRGLNPAPILLQHHRLKYHESKNVLLFLFVLGTYPVDQLVKQLMQAPQNEEISKHQGSSLGDPAQEAAGHLN